MSFLKLPDLLPSALNRAGIQRHVHASSALDCATTVFRELFGPELQQRITPLYVRGDELCVRVQSSVLANEIRLRERRILEQIQKQHPGIQRLRVQLS